MNLTETKIGDKKQNDTEDVKANTTPDQKTPNPGHTTGPTPDLAKLNWNTNEDHMQESIE